MQALFLIATLLAAPGWQIDPAEASAQTSPLGVGLVNYWPLTSGYIQSATVGSDRTTYDFHLTAAGTPPVFAADGITFNGVNDIVSVTLSSSYRSADNVGSVSFWAKCDPGDNVYAFAAADSAVNTDWVYFGIATGKPRYFYNDAGVSGGRQTSLDGYDDGEWHHIVVTHNGSTPTIYVDDAVPAAVLIGTSQNRWFNDFANLVRVSSGIVDRSSQIIGEGSVIGVRVHNRILSADDVNSLYQEGRRVVAVAVAP